MKQRLILSITLAIASAGAAIAHSAPGDPADAVRDVLLKNGRQRVEDRALAHQRSEKEASGDAGEEGVAVMKRSRQHAVRASFAAMLLSSALLAVFAAACTAWPPGENPDARVARYLHAHPDTPPAVANALRQGHVLVGMNREQVTVTVGEARMRRSYRDRGHEVWLYPAALFHQSESSHGAVTARIAFVDDHVAVVEFF